MHNRYDIGKAIAAALAMALLIIDNRFAITTVAEGVQMCIQSVVPALFPFLVLASMLSSSLHGLPKPLLRLFRVSPAGGSVLITGLLGGYPIGAKALSDAYTQGRISRAEAQRLLPICNQCGPAFLFGMTSLLFRQPHIGFALWAIQLLSVLLTAWLIPPCGDTGGNFSESHSLTFPQALNQAIKAMASICGWIILFRLLIGCLQRWFLWLMPLPYRIALCGFLELTNGFTALQSLSDKNLQFLIAAILVSFGGLCVTMQTLSVLHRDLSSRLYFPGKVLQTCLCILLVSLLQAKVSLLTGTSLIVAAGCVLFFRRTKKEVAFSKKMLYNDPIKDTRTLLCCSERK